MPFFGKRFVQKTGHLVHGNGEDEVTCSKRIDLSLLLKEQSYSYYEVNVTITSDEPFYKGNSIVIPIVEDYVLFKCDYLQISTLW